jgi:hypothetical protein
MAVELIKMDINISINVWRKLDEYEAGQVNRIMIDQQ